MRLINEIISKYIILHYAYLTMSPLYTYKEPVVIMRADYEADTEKQHSLVNLNF